MYTEREKVVALRYMIATGVKKRVTDDLGICQPQLRAWEKEPGLIEKARQAATADDEVILEGMLARKAIADGADPDEPAPAGSARIFYSREEKVLAVAYLEICDGNTKRASRGLGISWEALRAWRKDPSIVEESRLLDDQLVRKLVRHSIASNPGGLLARPARTGESGMAGLQRRLQAPSSENYTAAERNAALDILLACDGDRELASEATGVNAVTLWKWAKDGRTLCGMIKPRKPSVYLGEDEKLAAVRRVLLGEPQASVAREIGVTSSTLRWWMRAYEEDGAELLTREDVTARVQEGGADDGGIEELRRQNYELQLELAVLRETVEVLKGDGTGAKPLTSREKTQVAGALSKEFPLSDVLAALGLARSTYFYNRKALQQPDKYGFLRPLVRDIFYGEGCSRGYRFITAKPRRLPDPVVVSEKVVRRIMREEGLLVVYEKRATKAYSSYEGEIGDAPANLVARDFHADAPNALWLSDIAEFRLPGAERRGRSTSRPSSTASTASSSRGRSARGPPRSWPTSASRAPARRWQTARAPRSTPTAAATTGGPDG